MTQAVPAQSDRSAQPAAATPAPTAEQCREITDLPPAAVLACSETVVRAARSLVVVSRVGRESAVAAADSHASIQQLRFGRFAFESRRLANVVYVHENAALLRAFLPRRVSTPLVRAVRGRWIAYRRGTRGFREFGSDAGLRSLESGVLQLPAPLRSIAGPVVGGRPTVGITGGAHGDRVYIAASGAPYPLLVRAPDGQPGSARLLWNRPVHVLAPPARRVMSGRVFDRIERRLLRPLEG